MPFNVYPHPHVDMCKMPKRKLKTNPFTAYRDPKTGQWFVVKPQI